MAKESCYTVYMHTNIINGKKYIGITSRRVTERWINGKGYTHGKFKTAISKYGWDAFQHDIIKSNICEDDAKLLEIELIKKYKTTEREFGYNIHIGGNIKFGYRHTEEAKKKISIASINISDETREKLRTARKKMIYTDERRRKISESHKGKKKSAEHLKRISEANTGDKNIKYWKGKKRDIKTCEKISEKLSKKVICLQSHIIYNSITEASKLTGYTKSCIQQWCNGVKPRFADVTFNYYIEEVI